MLTDSKGFTLIEFLVAFVVSTLLATGLYIAYKSNYRSFNVSQDILEMQMNGRTALAAVSRTLRLVGFGSRQLYSNSRPEDITYNSLTEDPSYSDDFSSKLIFFKPATSNNGTAEERSDAIAVAYASRYVGKINSVVDDTTIVLDDASALSTNATIYQKYNIYIYPDPYQQNYKLSSLSGNTLTFTQTHHAQVGDDCYLLKSKFIHIVDNNLRIDDNISPSSANNDVAENIEAIQFQVAIDQNSDGVIDSSEWQDSLSDQQIPNVKGFRIFILARTANPDPDYTDTQTYQMADQTFGPFNDNYHRMLLTATVIPRNLYYGN